MSLKVIITDDEGVVLESEMFLTRNGETVNVAAAAMIDKLGFTWDQPEEPE